jgi:hypothetical protein
LLFIFHFDCFIAVFSKMRGFNTIVKRAVMPRVKNLNVRFNSHSAGVITTEDNMLCTPNGPLTTTTELSVVDTTKGDRWPVFRLLQATGHLAEGVPEPKDLNEELSVKMYSSMVQIQVLDEIMNLAQRQGRISFYMQAAGEEAIHVGKFRAPL